MLAYVHHTDMLFTLHEAKTMCTIIAARALATYLIPGRVGRGVRLGSESSSGGGGVWKSGVQKIEKNQNSQNSIRSAQNVGKVWISRKKILLAPFGAI